MKRALLVLALLALLPASAHAMKLNLLQGQTCANSAPRPCLVSVFIQDSSSTVGAGLTGLTSGSAGLVCYYARSDQGNAAATQHTLGAGTRGTWSATSNFVEKDATNMPGAYELSLVTGMLAANATNVVVMCKGATNMAPMLLEIALVNYDPQDSVRLGLTALPNATAGANTGLPVVGTQVPNATAGATNGLFIAGTNAATTITTGLTTTFTGNLTGSVASVTGAVGSVTGAVGSVTARVTANADQWAGGTIPAVNVTGVPLVDLKYTLGTISPAAAGSVRADLTSAAIATTLWQDLTAGADFGTANSIGALLKADVDATISSRSTYAGADTAGTTTLLTRLPSAITLAAGAVTVGTNNDKTGYSLTQAFPTNFSLLSIDANGRAKIQAWVQKNTALAGVSFQMTDSTTNLPKTGLAPSCTRNIDGGAFGAGTLANIAEISSGWYRLDYGAGDLNGGNIITLCTAAGANDIGWTLGTYP